MAIRLTFVPISGEAPATSNEGDHSEYGVPAGSREEAQRSISYLMTLLVAPVLNGFQEVERQVGRGGEDEETELHHNKKIKLTTSAFSFATTLAITCKVSF